MSESLYFLIVCSRDREAEITAAILGAGGSFLVVRRWGSSVSQVLTDTDIHGCSRELLSEEMACQIGEEMSGTEGVEAGGRWAPQAWANAWLGGAFYPGWQYEARQDDGEEECPSW